MAEKDFSLHAGQLNEDVDLLLQEQESFLILVVKNYAWQLQLYEADVDDLVQECRIRLWRKWTKDAKGSVGTIGNIQGYLRRVAYRICVDHLRTRNKLQTTSLTSPEAHDWSSQMATENTNPETLAVEAEEFAQLVRAINTLPRSSQRVLLLRCFLDLGLPQTSECLGLAESSVRSGITRARKRLKGRLADQRKLDQAARHQHHPTTSEWRIASTLDEQTIQFLVLWPNCDDEVVSLSRDDLCKVFERAIMDLSEEDLWNRIKKRVSCIFGEVL
jgi:RNA polymerase sigma-70 factor (ECF subfamily)